MILYYYIPKNKKLIGFLFAILIINPVILFSQNSCQLSCATSISTQDFDNIYSIPGLTPTAPRTSKNVVFDWEACDCKYWYAKVDNSNAIKIPHPFYDGVRTNAVINIFASKDYLKTNGWELLLHDFGQISPTKEIYFILYNRFTGVLRTYWYSYSAGSQPTTAQKYVFTLSFSNLYKPTGTLAMANSDMSASDTYLQTTIDGYKDVMVYEAPALAKNQWTVGEFQLGADSYIKDLGYKNSIMQLQISAVTTSTVKLSITGTTNTMDSEEYFRQNSTNVDGIAYQASATKGANGTVQKLEAYNAKATEYITKATEFRKKIVDGSANLYNSLASTNSVFLKENVMKPAAKINDLAKDGGPFDKIFGVASKVLSGFTGGIEVLKFVGNTLGFLSPGEETNTVPTPVRPTITSYDLSVNGTIETPSYVLNIPFKIPGVSTDFGTSNLQTYYDCPAGIISLDNTPILSRFNYGRLVEYLNSTYQYSTPYKGWVNYSSYKLTNDLVFTFNQGSNLELVELKAAIVANGQFELTESMQKQFNSTVTINTITGGPKIISSPSTGSSTVQYYQNQYYFNPVVSEIGSNVLEMYKYNPNNLNNTTIGTPLIDYRMLKGMTITVPSNVEIKILVIGVFNKKNTSNSSPVIISKTFRTVSNIATTADNLNYNSGMLAITPFSNYINQFNSYNYSFDYNNKIIPVVPTSTQTITGGGKAGSVVYTVLEPPQSGIFAEASSLLSLTNITTNTSKCLKLINGLPSTNCTPTTDPIVFQASNVVLKNNVVFSKDSRVVVRNTNLGYSLPPVSSGSIVKTIAAPTSCYNSNAILMRKGITEEAESVKPFPNPVTNGLLNFGRQVSNYELLSITGNSLKTGTNTEIMNVEGLPTGVYILKYDGRTEKIVIQ